jgi:hypothetical protein
MSKKVVWGQPKVSSSKRTGKYKNVREFLKKANAIRDEQLEAQEYLMKAMPAMSKLLELRLRNGEGLMVMRPLNYMTSVMKSEEEDDGFYNVRKSENSQGFVDKRVTIMPGTKLMLKSLDVGLREFVFNDAMGKEHAINFDDKNLLMTQTDVFETVRNLFEANKGE